jgi:hypothetical protein
MTIDFKFRLVKTVSEIFLALFLSGILQDSFKEKQFFIICVAVIILKC